jgi:hypothetical protein
MRISSKVVVPPPCQRKSHICDALETDSLAEAAGFEPLQLEIRSAELHRANGELGRRSASRQTRAPTLSGAVGFCVGRNKKGQFKESEDVGRSLAQDRRRKAKTVAPRGQGDRGDRRLSR